MYYCLIVMSMFINLISNSKVNKQSDDPFRFSFFLCDHLKSPSSSFFFAFSQMKAILRFPNTNEVEQARKPRSKKRPNATSRVKNGASRPLCGPAWPAASFFFLLPLQGLASCELAKLASLLACELY